MKNKEVVTVVRDFLFHLILSCGKTEEKAHIVNACEVDYQSLQYLTEIVNVLKDYEIALIDFIKIVRRELGNN